MEHVGVGLRAVAALIDMVLVAIVGYAFAAVFGGATATGFNLQGLPFLLWLIVSIGYFAVLEKQYGWTLGKRLIGLRVVRKEGAAPLDWQASIVRNVLRIIDCLPFFYIVGAIVIWVSKDKQRLGDMVANTVVVRATAPGGRP